MFSFILLKLLKIKRHLPEAMPLKPVCGLLAARENFCADLSSGDFAQSGNSCLIVAHIVHQWGRTVFQLAGAAGGGKRQIKVVGDFADAVFYSNTCHKFAFFNHFSRVNGSCNILTPILMILQNFFNGFALLFLAEAMGFKNMQQIAFRLVQILIFHNKIKNKGLLNFLLGF